MHRQVEVSLDDSAGCYCSVVTDVHVASLGVEKPFQFHAQTVAAARSLKA